MNETVKSENDQPNIITLDDLVIEFASNFSLGMKAILAAAETYATALRKYPTKARQVFAEKFPNVRRETWEVIEDIGNGKLPPQATMMTSGAIAKLREAKLPKRIASRLADTKVSVYNPSTGKFADVPFTHLTESQADIVLNPVTHDLRSVEQQKRYIAREAAVKDVPRVKAKEWTIVDGCLLTRRMAKITLAELKEIVLELEKCQ